MHVCVYEFVCMCVYVFVSFCYVKMQLNQQCFALGEVNKHMRVCTHKYTQNLENIFILKHNILAHTNKHTHKHLHTQADTYIDIHTQ